VRFPDDQAVSFGYPLVSCGDAGLPKLRKFWVGAPAPCGPSIEEQSGSAYWMPYGCHGRPQWKLPPRYSNVIQCMWPSTRPPTFPNGRFVAGVPVAFRSASG
jgi:hypothetical protein